MAPQVSVVLPTHNRRELLARTLSTVLQQQVEFEVIVIDDGSSDETGESLSALADPRIRYLRNEIAGGVARARNRGIEQARGEWIAFVDDDDLWAPHKLTEQLEVATRERRQWVYAGAVKIDERERLVGGRPPPAPEWVARRLPRWNAIPGGCSGVVALRSLAAKTGGFDPELVNLADWDLWIRFAQESAPACSSKPLVAYRWHSGNASLDTNLIMREGRVIEDRYGVSLDWGAIHYYLAHLNVRSGDRRRALRHFTRAFLGGELSSARDVAWLVKRRLKRDVGADEIPSDREIVAWRAEAEKWLKAG